MTTGTETSTQIKGDLIAHSAIATSTTQNDMTSDKPRRSRRSHKAKGDGQQAKGKKRIDPLRGSAKKALEILRARKDDEVEIGQGKRSVDEALELRRTTRDPEYRKATAKLEQIKMGVAEWKENVTEDGKIMCSSGLPIEADGSFLAVFARDVEVITFPVCATIAHAATDMVDKAMVKSGCKSFARFMEENPEFARIRVCARKNLEQTSQFVGEDAAIGILCQEVMEKVIQTAHDYDQTLNLEGLEEKLTAIEANTRTGKKVLRQLVFGLECPIAMAIGEKKEDGSPLTAIGFLLYGVDPETDSAEILPVSGKASNLIKRIRRLEEAKAKPNQEILELLTVHVPFAPKVNGQEDNKSPVLEDFVAICRAEQEAFRKEQQQQLAAKAQVEAAKASKGGNKKR